MKFLIDEGCWNIVKCQETVLNRMACRLDKYILRETDKKIGNLINIVSSNSSISNCTRGVKSCFNYLMHNFSSFIIARPIALEPIFTQLWSMLNNSFPTSLRAVYYKQIPKDKYSTIVDNVTMQMVTINCSWKKN